jgi:hypothetical protein
MLCITLCLQLPNRKSVVNYFNKSSYFCSNVYKSQKLYFLLLYCDVELYKVSYCIVLPLCSSDIHFVFKIHPSRIHLVSAGKAIYFTLCLQLPNQTSVRYCTRTTQGGGGGGGRQRPSAPIFFMILNAYAYD